ncbi:MAG: hypothetical protein FWD68_16075, partial [Alphaproteobacteria bacterium]|nr:hypothetical protein [Alphaproteobacteria bacterium]
MTMCIPAPASRTTAPCGVAASLLVTGMILAAWPQAAVAQSPGFCTAATASSPLCTGGTVTGLAATLAAQRITDSIRDNIRDNIRDSIHDSINHSVRTIVPPAPPSPERGRSSSPDPSQLSDSSPGAAVYGPAAKEWLYGTGLFASADRGIALDTHVSVATVAGAADVTRIGIFSATDALTFIATGLNSWTTTKTTGLQDTSSAIPATS